jgi:hypothetical protein
MWLKVFVIKFVLAQQFQGFFLAQHMVIACKFLQLSFLFFKFGMHFSNTDAPTFYNLSKPF